MIHGCHFDKDCLLLLVFYLYFLCVFECLLNILQCYSVGYNVALVFRCFNKMCEKSLSLSVCVLIGGVAGRWN